MEGRAARHNKKCVGHAGHKLSLACKGRAELCDPPTLGMTCHTSVKLRSAPLRPLLGWMKAYLVLKFLSLMRAFSCRQEQVALGGSKQPMPHAALGHMFFEGDTRLSIGQVQVAQGK